MAFKDTYRLEKVYYENMWTLLRSLKALKENPSADEITKVNEILDDTIACNESIIIIYKNLGELYAEVAEKFVDLLTDLKAIRDDLEMWKNEINEKIDEVNNYLMGLIRDLDDRVTSLEGRVSDLEDRMTTAENDIDALEGRMDTAEGDIDALEGRMDTAEGDIDALEGRMDTAEDDIDGLQGDVSDLEQNKQDKLTAGFGIEIDSNNEISVDTADVQEKLIAGQNITLTPDATDPTKTVIDATGGSSYTAGTAIDIDANNKINYVFPKLILGTGVRQIKSITVNLYQMNGQNPLMCGSQSADLSLTKSEIEDMLNDYGMLFIFINNTNVQSVIPSNGDTMSVFAKMSLQCKDSNNNLSNFGSSGFAHFVYTERKPQGSGVKFTHADYPTIEITDELRRILDVMNKNNLSSITLRVNFTYSVYFDGKIISELSSVADPDIANLTNYNVTITGRY